jgi:hypothetical protein
MGIYFIITFFSSLLLESSTLSALLKDSLDVVILSGSESVRFTFIDRRGKWYIGSVSSLDFFKPSGEDVYIILKLYN